MEWVQFQDGMREDPLINEIGFLCVPSCDPQFVVENHKMGMSYGFATQLYEQAHARFLPLCSLDTRLQDVSETEKVSRALLVVNGLCYTAWNMRKCLVTAGVLRTQEELDFTTLILTKHTKSDCAWAHRRWLLEQMEGVHLTGDVDREALLQRELLVCTDMAERYARNYYAWSHRQWVISRMNPSAIVPEWESVLAWTRRNVSDASAHAHRRGLLSIDPTATLQRRELSATRELLTSFPTTQALLEHMRILELYYPPVGAAI